MTMTQQELDAWNEDHPAGTLITVKQPAGGALRKPVWTKTATVGQAWFMGEQAVVHASRFNVPLPLDFFEFGHIDAPEPVPEA